VKEALAELEISVLDYSKGIGHSTLIAISDPKAF
jgi:hypothetical protein